MEFRCACLYIVFSGCKECRIYVFKKFELVVSITYYLRRSFFFFNKHSITNGDLLFNLFYTVTYREMFLSLCCLHNLFLLYI